MSTVAEPLDNFEGMPVLAVGIELPTASGGLNEALAVDPDTWHVGDEATIILRGPCKKIRYEPLAKVHGLRRVHVFGIEQATVVDDDFADEMLAAQAERIAESKRGPLDDELARSELTAAHEEGAHDDEDGAVELANGEIIRCPKCRTEPDEAE